MVMMVTVRTLRFHRGLHVLGQGFESVLGGGGIVRLQRGLERGEIVAQRAVVAEKLAQRILPVAVLQISLKSGQGALGRRQIAGLDVAANAFEVIEELSKTIRGGGLIRRRV